VTGLRISSRMAVKAAAVETGHVSANRFQALIQTHVEPVVVRAGFAEGQWAVERGAPEDPTCSVIFCAGGSDYVGRYPHLTDDGSQWAEACCVDIMIEGSIRDGVTRLDVEFETLGRLLARTGRRSAVERLPRLLRLRDPERDFEDLAAVLSDLYAV